MALLHPAAAPRAILYKGPKMPPAINQFAQALYCQATIQLLSWPASIDQSQSKRKSRDCWPGQRKKIPAKGMSPPRGHLSLKQGLTLLPPWWRTRPRSDCTQYGSHRAGCLPAGPVPEDGGSLVHYQGKGQAGASGPQEDLHHRHLHTG